MNKLLLVLSTLFKHIVLNVSNYMFFIGVLFILFFIAHTFGTPTLILCVGVLLVAFSIVLELSKTKEIPKKKY